ncbi:hypothetical protein BWK59_11660 [Flavobacterium davisii]|uniref:Peptidase S24/S26A/S26B/S26C domain-containing protein n=1 Tax=Flavobacterium davisii TaxID=2906077 RepID=A0A246GGC4_9FLAO|nr:hypothetical protein [Flavobacterium davisii]OWP83226.1 hypothetical protein BWK59_11660 [Flavobacterium davisii]
MIIDRILKFIEYKGISKSKFYKETSLSNGFLDKVKDIGVSKIEHILTTYPDINIEWLLLGKGEMLKTKNEDYANKDNVGINVSEINKSPNMQNSLINNFEIQGLKLIIEEQKNIIIELKEQCVFYKESSKSEILASETLLEFVKMKTTEDSNFLELGNKLDELLSYIQLNDKLNNIKATKKNTGTY